MVAIGAARALAPALLAFGRPRLAMPMARRLASPRACSTDAAAPAAFEELASFREVVWPEKYPFEDPRYFARGDEDPDVVFYEQPRFVTHIDDGAIKAVTSFYASKMQDGADVLDLCSSWISHLPEELALGRVAGVGMNAEELGRNGQLTEFAVQDLNIAPTLPYDDASFDFVCNVVSVDYLTKPTEIFKEMHRVLRPGGTAIMSFSNRCFPSKAIAIWGQTDDSGHIWIVGSYYKFSAAWDDIYACDITDRKAGGDPMYVVVGKK